MTYTLFTALVTFAVVTLITPGPNNLMLMASGMNYGYRRSLPHITGISLGFSFMIFMVGVGVLQLLDLIPHGQLILKSACVTYLFYLAWKIATAAPLKVDSAQAEKTGKPLTFIQAALFQWVNPKAWSMAITAVSVYTPQSQQLWDYFMVAAVFAVFAYPLISLWVLLGQKLRSLLNDTKKMRIFNITCAALLVLSLYPIISGQ